MRVRLESFVPYDRSVQWRLHDAYYAACGRAAWQDGQIPSFATSNFAMARQHAALFVEVVRELEASRALPPTGSLSVLEIGGGSGAFAANFLLALDTGLGAEGKRVGQRVRYVFTDYAETTVREAVQARPLRNYARRLVPGLFDLRRPGPVRTFEGGAVDGPFTAVFANYVACVAPLKILRQRLGTWFEQLLSIGLEVPDDAPRLTPAQHVERLLANPTAALLMEHLDPETRWKEVDLDALFPDPLHAGAVRGTIGGLTEGVLTYPHTFVDCLRELRGRLVKGGLVLVADYGATDARDLESTEERVAQHYGNVVNHGVAFALFDAVAPLLGMSVARTTSPLRSVHVAALRLTRRLPASFRDAFQRLQVADSSGDDALVWGEAASRLAREGEFALAARLYERCVHLDPDSAELRFHLADTCVRARFDSVALEHAGAGQSLDVDSTFDFHFILGRVHYRGRRFGDAIAEYTLSLQRDKHPITWTNLGIAHEGQGELAEACDAYREALALKPDSLHANARLKAVEALRRRKSRR